METLDTTYAADRFNALIEELCRVLTKHARTYFIDEAMQLLIWNRLVRMSKRFAGLAARVAAGQLSNPPPALNVSVG